MFLVTSRLLGILIGTLLFARIYRQPTIIPNYKYQNLYEVALQEVGKDTVTKIPAHPSGCIYATYVVWLA